MADWAQTFTVLAVFIGAFLYMMNRMDSNQRENNRRFEGMDTRFNGLENRLTSMESEIKNTNQRIDNTNQRIDGTNQRISELKMDINQRLSTIEGYLVPKKIFRFEEPHHDPDEPKEN